MLEKPDLPDEALAAALRTDYALRVVEIAFLPLGADWKTAVYRVAADDRRAYFLKLRSGTFDDTGVVVPGFGATWGGAREAALFYGGYGPIEPIGPDRAALAYYRYHRIVEDIAVDCAEIFDTSDGGASRAQMLGMLALALRPGGALDVARRLDAN